MQGLIKSHHAVVGRVLHDLFHVLDLALADFFLNQRRIEQHFERHMTAASVNGGNELLRNHAPEVEGQVKKNLLMLVFREKVQDTVQSLVGVVGVQGGQEQMARSDERRVGTYSCWGLR